MRNVVLYLSMSLDGYLADRLGGVDWLTGDGSDPAHPGSYPDFFQTVDTILMGAATYRQVTTELSPGQWPYPGCTTYVFSRRPGPSGGEVVWTDRPPEQLAAELKPLPGRDIWVCGGASLAQRLTERGLIDRFHIAVIPTLLGSGLRLFGPLPGPLPLRLAGTRAYNGIVELIYENRTEETPLFLDKREETE